MKTGDVVSITYAEHTVPGHILLASANAKSLMLGFEAVLGGHVGTMPVLQGDDGAYRSIITHQPVAIRPCGASA